jgi:hypothetical protein
MRPRIEQASLLAGVRSTDRKGTAKCDYAYVLGAKYVWSRHTAFEALTQPFLGFVLNPKSKNINKTHILVRNVKL